jgi:hypothetical protein
MAAKRALVPAALACLALGCGRRPAVPARALADDPVRLHALVAQCRRGERDAAFCRPVMRADLQRFLSGRTGPDEYRTLAELPPIPATFDGPAGEEQP